MLIPHHTYSSGLGDRMRVARGDPPAHIPGPLPAQLGDARRARPAARPDHRDAPRAARTLARAEFTR